MSKNLIVCSTPLHMLIAEKIINMHPSEEFDLLLITDAFNEKYNFYRMRLSSRCNKTFFFKINAQSKIKYLMNFISFKFFFKNLNFDYSNYYIVNITSRYVQYIVSNISNGSIYTFDDGLANIYKYGIMHHEPIPNFVNNFIWKFLGVKKYSSDIKKEIKMHYTIFQGAPNIVEKIHYISLVDVDIESCTEVVGVKKIFLGQPLAEVGSNKEDLLKTLQVLGIDYYFKHPREQIVDLSLNIIETKLIFEEYMVNLLECKRNFSFEIYTFSSSAAINVASLNRVSVYFVYSPFVNKSAPFLYQEIEKLGFNVINKV